MHSYTLILRIKHFLLITSLIFLAPLTYAVELSQDGHGDAALFPYYSAKSNWQTFIRIINDSAYATVTKIRFKEAANGRTVSDFVLFLAPYDQWHAWTDSNTIDNLPGIKTNDSSCIFSVSPNLTPVSASFISLNSSSNLIGAKFSDYGFTGIYDDGGNASNTVLERLSEGQIEVIGISKFSSLSANASAVRFVDFVKNNPSTGKPNNCLAAKSEYIGTLKSSEENLGYGSEFDFSNTMFAKAYLVNISTGQGAGYNPSILSSFSNTSLIAESISSETKPDLDSANTSNIWTNKPRVTQHGILGNSIVTGGVDTLSTKFTRSSISNEWALKTSSNPNSTFKNSFTQWVISFPTKQFYVDLQTDPKSDDDISPTLASFFANDDAWAPFRQKFTGTGSSCTPYTISLRNSEGGLSSYHDAEGLCYQTNVLSFGSQFAKKGLASSFSTIIPANSLPLNATNTTPAKRGSARLYFDDSDTTFAEDNLTDDNGITYHGVPVHGFMLYNYESANQSQNYTTALPHSYYRKTTTP